MASGRHTQMVTVTVEDDCPAVAVPWGTPTTLAAGRTGYVTQRLGGTITVMVDGNLYRVDGRYADALGLDHEPAQGGDAGSDDQPSTVESVEAAAWQRMATCYDPEIPVNIVDLGLIYGCEVSPTAHGGFRIAVRMTLTAPGCGMGTLRADEVREKLQGIGGVEQVDVDLVWDPPWSRDSMSEAARLEMGLM